jgi:hypothetical protein
MLHCCIFCKCFQRYVASVCLKYFICSKRLLPQVFYLDFIYVSHTCCKCFIWMFYIFHIHIVSVLSRCCICFTHMLQVFCLDVAYVSQICCTNMFQMFHLSQIMFHSIVSCCKCFAWARCMGAQPERRGWGAMSWEPAPESRPRGERGGVRGK